MKRDDHRKRLMKQACTIAASGRHNGWFHIAWELRDSGEPLALDILGEEPLRSELDRLSAEARPAWLAQRRSEGR
jgi:hypothetical protein